ncbi:hypothetical protein M9H77_07078 [Catharanthus roseus]|uniref:Uncharacterized protein n=1 Tax=Catharanthus roseus TaxID=4058 RepID=A0ACC0BU61_CATRO|nr:hypothetical protein M9H77_07078 [Catharanthus roseus]
MSKLTHTPFDRFSTTNACNRFKVSSGRENNERKLNGGKIERKLDYSQGCLEFKKEEQSRATNWRIRVNIWESLANKFRKDWRVEATMGIDKNCQIMRKLLVRYLGVPLSTEKLTVADYDPLIGRKVGKVSFRGSMCVNQKIEDWVSRRSFHGIKQPYLTGDVAFPLYKR